MLQNFPEFFTTIFSINVRKTMKVTRSKVQIMISVMCQLLLHILNLCTLQIY